MRMKKVYEALTCLEAESIEAEVIWGVEAANVINPIKKCVHDLNRSLMKYFNENLWAKLKVEEKDIITNMIYNSSETDDFTKNVDAAIVNIKDYLKSHLRA